MGKKFALVFIVLLVAPLVMLPHMRVMADTASDSNVICKLTVFSPTSDVPYTGTMFLQFRMDWSVTTIVIWMYMNMSYSVDDNPKISINDGNTPAFNPAAQGYVYHYRYLIFPPNSTTTSSTIDISNLTSGAHKLIIYADGFYDLDNDFLPTYNFSSSPKYFSVDYVATYPTPSPSPTPTPAPTPTPTPTPTPMPTPTLTPTPTPSPLPTPTPTPTPTLPSEIIYSITAATIVAIAAVAAVLIVFIKKKQTTKKQAAPRN